MGRRCFGANKLVNAGSAERETLDSVLLRHTTWRTPDRRPRSRDVALGKVSEKEGKARVGRVDAAAVASAASFAERNARACTQCPRVL